jgi:hypothetical protein
MNIRNNHPNRKEMRLTCKWKLTASCLILALSLLLLPSFASAQTNTAKSRDTLNIGFVLYTKAATPGTLNARWNYANIWSGPGVATGGPKEGFAGNYHVKYFYENGEFSDEYDLLIEKTGDFYSVSWISKAKVLAKGVGMETQSGLAVGWRRIND